MVTDLGQSAEHAEALRQLAALRVTSKSGASLNLDRGGDLPTYAVGDTMRISLRVASEANALVLEQRSDGTIVQWFPTADSPFPRVKANRLYTVPDNDRPPLAVTGPNGRRTIRLVLFPPGTDVGSLTPRLLTALRGDVLIVERSLEVVPSR